MREHVSERADTPVSVEHLSVTYPTDRGDLHAVSDLTLGIRAAEVVGVVGESGSGKTTLAQAILGLLEPDIARGSLTVRGTDVLKATPRQIRRLRKSETAAILQDPLASLNPVRTIRSQLIESAKATGRMKNAHSAVLSALTDVGLDPDKVLTRHPHMLSGGMNQRVAIAMALLKEPRLLIADEPTSALDLRTQASIMRLLLSIRERYEMAIMIVTHDLELALGSCDRVAVMYAGRLVEIGPAGVLPSRARHPYTRALLDASPKLGDKNSVKPIPGRFDAVLGDASGCPFVSRCSQAVEACTTTFPAVHEGDSDVWCWNPVREHAGRASR